MKRLFDIVLSLICLIIFSPLFIACYLTIKLSGGPAIYKQERIGRRGKPFYIYKFRSMKTDAEENGIELQRSDNDPRLTRIGKFLRSHHLDELPQLWNVFIGDMAFVGSGYALLRGNAPQVAAGVLAEGDASIIGFGRTALAYPGFAQAMIDGSFDAKRSCTVCGNCYKLLRALRPTGCPIRDAETYLPLLREVLGK